VEEASNLRFARRRKSSTQVTTPQRLDEEEGNRRSDRSIFVMKAHSINTAFWIAGARCSQRPRLGRNMSPAQVDIKLETVFRLVFKHLGGPRKAAGTFAPCTAWRDLKWRVECTPLCVNHDRLPPALRACGRNRVSFLFLYSRQRSRRRMVGICYSRRADRQR
jgi:hypothetical protein